MIRVGVALFCCLSAGVSAQSLETAPGNFLCSAHYATPGTGAQSYFVDASAGSDAFDCRTTSTPCLTIQGAVNKVPKVLRDGTIVNVAAGNYAGFTLSGFSDDYGLQQTTGGLLIDGALVNSTLASGSATGTATSGTQGGGVAFGALTDTSAAWTVNDLVGRLLTTAAPTNTGFIIESNTATTITVAAAFDSAPGAGTTYTIQDPSVVITSGAAIPPGTFFAGLSNRAGILAYGNNMRYAASAIGLRNMRVAGNPSVGVLVLDSAVFLMQMQVRSASASASGVTGGAGSGPAVLSIYNTDIATSPTGSLGSGVSLGTGSLDLERSLLRNIGSGVGAAGVSVASGVAPSLFLFFNSVKGFDKGVQLNLGSLNSVPNFKGNHITCSTSAGVGVIVGSATSTFAGVPAGMSSMQTLVLATCGVGVQVSGGAALDITSVTGTVATTGLSVNTGSLVTIGNGGASITAGVNQISIDSGGLTANFSDVSVGSCLSTSSFASRVCGR